MTIFGEYGSQGPEGSLGSQGAQGNQGYQGNQGDQGAQGASGGGATPDYDPPCFMYKDADEITVRMGKYYACGHRIRGQYQNTSDMGTSWTVSSNTDVDVDAGGTLIGGVSSGGTGSWYSVFMTSASTFLVLPYIRVDTISESGGTTTITPAAHDDGTTADNTFVTGDDVFNTYRLVYISFDSNDGTTWTISDTTNGTPDEIDVAEDITGVVSAADWLQMIPPSGTACLYLGTIRMNNSGTLLEFIRYRNFITHLSDDLLVSCNNSVTIANTDIGPCVPPVAIKIIGDAEVAENADHNRFCILETFYGTTSSDIINYIRVDSTENYDNNSRVLFDITMYLSAVSIIRNKAFASQGSEEPADSSGFRIYGWEE